MSVSLVLVPLALPLVPVFSGLRLVLGEEKYSNFIENIFRMKRVYIPTDMSDFQEVIDVLDTCGYRADQFGKQLQTPIVKLTLVYWTKKDSRIYLWAYDMDEQKAHAFMQEVETKLGKKLFYPEHAIRDKENSMQHIPTDFQDGKLLLRTLVDHGLNPDIDHEGRIVCAGKDLELIFHKEGNAPYSLDIYFHGDQSHIQQTIQYLDEGYKRHVQSDVYEQLTENINTEQFQFIHEDILDDDSIVITLEVKDGSK